MGMDVHMKVSFYSVENNKPLLGPGDTVLLQDDRTAERLGC